MQHTLIRVLAIFALLITALLPACVCGGGAGGMPVCTGGAQLVGNGCYCPTGTTVNGSNCDGTPQQGSCAAGEIETIGANNAAVCTCPEGQVWSDTSMTACVACAGGTVASGDQCVCPDNSTWNGTQCEAIAAAPACLGGGVMTDQGCQCPDGTAWDGANCSASQQAAPQQQEVVQQQTIHRSVNVSLTCCVNHAKYTCPSQHAFSACATMQANHGCTPAGGC